MIQNTVTGNQSLYEIDRIAKHSAALRCIEKKCRARLSIEHVIETEPFGSNKGRVIGSAVLKQDLLNMNNWLKVYHSHTLKCKMTGPSICDKVEHKFKSCESKTDGQIIARKYRSFCIQEKVAKPHKSNATILSNADDKFHTLVDENDQRRHPDYKTDDCGIDDKMENLAMNRANLLSNGEIQFEPEFDHKIENQYRFMPQKNAPSEKFVWEEPTFIYFGLSSDLMHIHRSTVSCDGTFDDANALKIKRKKVWEQMYILTKLNRNDEGDRTFSDPIGFCLMKRRRKIDYKKFFQFLKRIFKEKFPDAGEFAPQEFRTDFEAAAIMAIADEFPNAIFKLCTFHLTKSFREKLISLYGGKFQKNKKVAVVWRFLRAVPYLNWSSSSRLIDAFLSLIEQSLPKDDRKSKLVEYLRNTYFDRNGQFRHFSYLQWDYFNDINNGDFNTTTNCSESINSAYNRHCKSGFRSANIIASNIFDFKYNMLAKGGLIRRYGPTKMNKMIFQ